VVSHGGPLRAVLLQCAADRDGSIENCAVFRFAYDGGRLIEVDLI
jgi:broad specificity phosphatase PhoE